MHRLVSIIAALVMLFALSATALGASPSEQECLAMNDESTGTTATFNRDKGTVTCTVTTEENVGNAPAHSNSQKVKSSDGDSSKGTLKNEPQYEPLPEECTGPGQGNSSAQCP
jgi:hypothetical protein